MVLATPLLAQTTIAVGSSTLVPKTKPVGINVGTMVTYGNQQIFKNLFAANPGFNNSKYNSVLYCTGGSTATSCVIYNSYFPANFWPTDGSATVQVMTGSAAGCTTTVSGFTANPPVVTFASGCGISTTAPYDYVEVSKTITAGNSGNNYQPAYGWSTSGSTTGAIFDSSSDAPPSANGTIYRQSLRLTAPSPADYAHLSAVADNQYLPMIQNTQSFINLNGTYSLSFWGKAISGANPSLLVSINRGGTNFPLTYNGAASAKSVAVPLTNTWAQYNLTFTASEGNVPQGSNDLGLAFSTTGQESVLMDKVSVTEPATAGNPTMFRDAVVSALQTLKPGSLRFWDGQTLTSSLSNMLADQWGRAPVGFRNNGNQDSGPVGYGLDITYSIPEALQLCKTVGSECWLTLPVTLTTTEASNLIDYLSGPTSTSFGALRQLQNNGDATPWTSVSSIPLIHLEFGNEEWNGGFAGGSMEQNGYQSYGNLAQAVFAAMKSDSNFVNSKMSLVLNGIKRCSRDFGKVHKMW